MKNSYIYKNADRIAVIILTVMMIFQVSLYKIFAGIIPLFRYSYNTPFLCALYLLAIVAVYLLVIGVRVFDAAPGERFKIFGKYRYLMIMLAVLLIAVISEDIITIAKDQLRITNILTHNLDYFYAFLSLPILILMVENKWTFEKMADSMLVISMISLAMRAFVSVYYAITGVEIEIISRESAFEAWMRNGRLRVVPVCFICLLAPIAMYLFGETKSIAKKIWYLCVMAIVAAYSLLVWQSRAGILIIAAGCGIMLLFKIMSRKNLIIRWSAVMVLGIAFMYLYGFDKIIGMFSMSKDSKFGGENLGHYYAYNLFWGRFLAQPMGEGLTETLAQWYPNGRALWMCDAGIMYSIVPMGILIIVFFVLMFSRGIYIYIKGYRNNKKAVLALALTFIILASEAAMDCFFTPLAFMVPFFIAIVEYCGIPGEDIG